MKAAFLFSGQGAQYVGMMKELYDSVPEARRVFECADDSLCRSITKLCFEGSQEDLDLTHNTQPCVLAADLAAGAALKARGFEPGALAGFSLGEYAALVYAGAIDMSEAFKLVQARADAMQAAVAPGKGAMAALIGAEADKIEALCAKVSDEYVVAANYNAPLQTVISGTVRGVDEVLSLAKEERIRGMKLAVSAPFHCELMRPAAEALAEMFKTIQFRDNCIPVYMNVNGRPVTDANEISRLLVLQAMSPVRWTDTLNAMQADDTDTFVECGPGKTLSGLAKKTLKNVTVVRVENMKAFDEACEAMSV